MELKLCQAQAKIFETSVAKTNCSSPVFIRRFAYSSISKSFDDQTYLFGFDSIYEVVDLINEEFGKSKYGKIKYIADQMFWIGYIYRCICIKYNLSSKSVYRLFDGRKIVDYYNICHTFDIVDAAERMMESINYDNSSPQQKAYKIAKRLLYTQKLIELIGRHVKVIVDRPIGYSHNGIAYKLNYGYIKNLKAMDGEYQDAYVLGVDEPIDDFEGQVIGIIHRKDDIEDKLLVADASANYSKQEIKKAINFQERYFKSKIILPENLPNSIAAD